MNWCSFLVFNYYLNRFLNKSMKWISRKGPWGSKVKILNRSNGLCSYRYFIVTDVEPYDSVDQSVILHKVSLECLEWWPDWSWGEAIYLHLFLAGRTGSLFKYDGDDTFFGFVCLNGMNEFAEWGYFSFQELKELRVEQPILVNGEPGMILLEVDYDNYWEIKKSEGRHIDTRMSKTRMIWCQ